MINTKNSKVITDSVFSVVNPTSIILFGSYAKNLETKDSDMDICVITEENKNPFDIMTALRLKLFDELNKAVDIVIYDKNTFDSRKTVVNTFEHEIYSTGVKLYG